MDFVVQQALMAGPQGWQLESMGNAPLAAQWYDQASANLNMAIGPAMMMGFPIGDQMFYWLAHAEFGAARTKSMQAFSQANQIFHFM